MNDERIRAAVFRAIGRVAPEADLARLDAAADFRDELDIDSMDFLRLAILVHDELHVDIPERDYDKVRTLDGCVAYLSAQLARKAEAEGTRLPAP